MLKTLNKKHLLASAAVLASIFAGCTPPPPTGTDPNAGTERASISGTVTKEDGSPADNATIVLIKRENNVDSDHQIVRSNSSGIYRFTKVPAGTYRVAFSGLSESERKNNAGLAYDPNGRSGEYYGFLTTAPFNYDGNTEDTFQVPSFNVGWKSELRPHDTTVSMSDGVTFSWQPVSGAKEYNVLIKDAQGNLFYQSPNSSRTTFTWSSADMKSNRGSTPGTAATPGLYYYLVNAVLNSPSGNSPIVVNGGTAEAKFTLQ